MSPTILKCVPSVATKLNCELDKYRGVAMIEGHWQHPSLPYRVDATREYMQELADKYNEHRLNVEIYTPEGHTLESSKNRGYIDRNQEAKIVDVEVDGKKFAALEMGFDIRDPETKRAAAAGTLGRSVAIDSDYKYSTPDGAVHQIGAFISHVAYTSDPVITNMPPLELVKEFSKDGTELQFVTLMDKHAVDDMDMGKSISKLTGDTQLTSDMLDDDLHHHFVAIDPNKSANTVDAHFKKMGVKSEIGDEAGIWTVEVYVDKEEHMFHFVPSNGIDIKQLASRLVTWQDPPSDVTNGSRKATHQECGYTAGTPEANCDRCLSRTYDPMPTDENPMAQPSISCAWVGNPIQVSGVCKYFRPRYYSYSKKINGETVVLMSDITDMRKPNQFSSSNKRTELLDSVLEAAWASLLGESKPSDKEVEMDVKLLAKELGVAETDDVKAFAKSVTESVSKSASSVAIITFAKDGFGIEVTDVTKAAELIKAELSRPHTETTAQLSKLTAELSETKTHLAEFAKTNAELAKANADRGITEQLSGLAGRIHLAKELGKMTKADEERILTIATEGDKAIQFVLQFSKESKYDGAWTRQLDRISAKMEEIELRPKGFAVKGETTKKNLSRFEQDPATLNDDEKPTEEALDKLWGKKKKVAVA